MSLPILLLATLVGPAVPPAPRARPVLPATRIDDAAVRVDGRVDEPAWKAVPLAPAFVQESPRYGFPPTHRTDVRIAYGERGLYVAFVCHDEPHQVRGSVARKDQIPPSDRVFVLLDPNDDDTNGYYFEANASGAQADAQVFQDGNFEFLWDGVWRAAARKHDHGWSAEIFVPYATLRFAPREVYAFGINVGRWVNHAAEKSSLSPPPQGLPGVLSYAAEYVGARGIHPRLNLELRPFVSGLGAPRRPYDTLDHSPGFSPNAGLEAKYGLRGTLALDVAINPDFGQAEVDPAVLNLGPFEWFFPERRQFFLESKEIFETRHQLFYSRRLGNAPSPGRAHLTERTIHGRREQGELVGIDPRTRILEAVRITGQPAPGWRVGALTATTGPTFGVQQFSDGRREPIGVDPTGQFSVARVRRNFGSQSYVGAIATSVIRFGKDRDATTGGVDYAVRFRERWVQGGQVIGTHDGRRAGMGANLDLVRTSKNSRIGIAGEALTPHANYNDIGYMQYNNYVRGDAQAEVFNAQPVGPLRSLWGSVGVGTTSTFEGLITRKQFNLEGGLTNLGLWEVGWFVGGQLPRLDVFETRGGIPYQFPLHWWTGGWTATPYTRRVVFRMNYAYGEQAGHPGPDVGIALETRPVDRLQLDLLANWSSSFGRPRWATRSAAGEPIFGTAEVITNDVVLRATVGILPNLTLQTYNQYFYSTAHHNRFYVLEDPYTLSAVDPRPYDGVVDRALSSLISNTIVRWEYLPGCFTYLVYTHRSNLDGSGQAVDWTAAGGFRGLGAPLARHEDIVFLKLVHLFAL